MERNRDAFKAPFVCPWNRVRCVNGNAMGRKIQKADQRFSNQYSSTHKRKSEVPGVDQRRHHPGHSTVLVQTGQEVLVH